MSLHCCLPPKVMEVTAMSPPRQNSTPRALTPLYVGPTALLHDYDIPLLCSACAYPVVCPVRTPRHCARLSVPWFQAPVHWISGHHQAK